jgi:hypothetical protein
VAQERLVNRAADDARQVGPGLYAAGDIVKRLERELGRAWIEQPQEAAGLGEVAHLDLERADDGESCLRDGAAVVARLQQRELSAEVLLGPRNLLRADAPTCTSFMTIIFQFAPLRRGIFLCFRIIVIADH